jgi:cell division protein FtsN
MTSDFRTLPRQRGNTLTGVIIGLIIGLVIAVAVALLIMKGGTPFTDKSGKSGKMGEPSADQIADPNKPMYSNKEAARQANKEVAGKQKQDDPLGDAVKAMEAPAPATAPAAKPPETKVAEVKPPAEVKPAEAKPAEASNIQPKPAAADSAEEKVTYYLQAGAFREIEDAENTRAKLALLGFEASISEKPNESGVLHRVRVGPFPQVETMNKARAKLIDSGIDVAIVKNQK